MIKTTVLLISIVMAFNLQLAKFEAPDFLQMSVEARASELGLETSEFILFSSVVEAESDRSDSLEGRILIAEVILNRLNDPRFQTSIFSITYLPHTESSESAAA